MRARSFDGGQFLGQHCRVHVITVIVGLHTLSLSIDPFVPSVINETRDFQADPTTVR